MAHKRNLTPLFFFGSTLLSSVGSMTMTISMIGFMIQVGYDLSQVGLLIGLSRLVPILISTFFGQFTDMWSPKKTVLVSELLAAASSIALLTSWSGDTSRYLSILSFFILRSVFVSIQVGSKAKITKALSNSSFESNAKNAAWLNKATQGATLFAGIIGLVAIKRFSLEHVILFDMATFILNGVIVYFLPIGTEQSVAQKEPVLQKFRDLYAINGKTALLDLLLATVMMGTAAFSARLAGASAEWNSILLISYGLAVWLSGFLIRLPIFKKIQPLIWLVLGVSFLAVGLSRELNLVTWSLMFVRDISFWILFHLITAQIQVNTPMTVTSSVNHARMAQMVTILALGEILVGAWKGILPLWADAGLRALIAVGVGIHLFTTKKEKQNAHITVT